MTITTPTPPGLPVALRMLARATAAAAAAVLLLVPTSATAQQALVVCPPDDAAGCDRIVDALGDARRSATDPSPAFPDGVHRHYEALRTMPVAELARYAVIVVPSLANEPYALLRDADVASRLRTTLRGRVAVFSGTPDRGTAESARSGKRTVIQSLARWAAETHAGTRATGLVVLQDFSDEATPVAGRPVRYSWLEGVAGVRVLPDTAVRMYRRAAVDSANHPALAAIGPLEYDNIASFGLVDPSLVGGEMDGLRVGGAAGWGRNAIGARSQVVLVLVDRWSDPAAPVGPGGGTLTFGSATTIGGLMPVQLTLAAGAVSGNTVFSASLSAVADTTVLPGSAVTISPAPYTFAAPVQLTISYAKIPLPVGGEARRLLLVHQAAGTGWLALGDVVVDTVARTVTAPIGGTGTFALALSLRPAVAALDLERETTTLRRTETRALTLTATDADGAPISGEPVAWRAGPGGTVVAAADTTDAAGRVVAQFTADSGLAGAGHVVTATAGGREATAVLTIVAGPAATVVAERGDGQAAVAGSALPVAPAVGVRDADGNAVAGVVVTFAVARGGGVLADSVAATDSSGVAAVGSWTLGTVAGPHSDSLVATVAGLPAVRFGASARSGAAARLTVERQPSSSAASGELLPVQPEVQVRDQHGNPVAASGVAVTATIASGGGTLAGTVTVATDAAGLARFTDLAIGGATGARTLRFAAVDLGDATSDAVVVGAGAAARIAVAVQPSATVQADIPFAQQPAAQLQDGAGNPVSVAGVVVTATIASGGGMLVGTTTATTDATGVATFTGLAIAGAVGDRTLALAAAGLAGTTTTTIQVTAGAPATLAVVTQPSAEAQSGVPFARQPVVRLEDASGNPVTQGGVTVTAAIASGGGTLGGTATATTDADGTATFAGLSIGGVAGARTLTFSAPGVSGATSAAITLAAGPPAQLALATPPSGTAQAGVAFAQQPAVQVRDAMGNPVAQAGTTVTAAIASGGGTLGGTATATTDAGGLATFTELSIGGSTGTRTLAFTAAGLAAVTSDAVVVGAGHAAGLAFLTQPSNTVASAPIAPAVQVAVVDGFGNPVTGAGGSVTLGLGTNPGGGTLAGTTTQALVDGVATFGGLALGAVGTGYTLSATSGALAAATSAAFDVTHGPLDHFLVEAAGGGPIGSQLAGTPFAVRVRALDAYDNTVTSFGGTVSFTTTPSGGLAAGATSGAFTAGVLTSHTMTMGMPGMLTLTATRTSGTESGTSNAFQVQAPPTAVNEGPAANSVPGNAYHAFYSTSGNPQTYVLPAPGVLGNDNLGFPTAVITSFGADSLGGSVTTYAAGSTVSPLPGTGRTTGSLRVEADGAITFTPPDGFTGNYVFRYRLTNVRGTSDARVTFAVGERPAAVADTYAPVLVGNVPVNTATSTQFRVTANDRGDRKVLAIVGQSGGTATLNADSTFTFRPTPGHEGAASFSYTVSNGFGTSAPATVSLTVANPIWFVDASAPADGDGRYDAPFNSLPNVAAINNGTGNNPAAGDRIFLNPGSYTGGITLLDQQRLYGAGMPEGTFASKLAVSWPADAGPLPTTGRPHPVITGNGVNVVTLNNVNGGNTIGGLTLGSAGATGTALHGVDFGTLTPDDLRIDTDGRALSLANGTLAGDVATLRSTGGTHNVFLASVGTGGQVRTLGTATDELRGATGSAVSIVQEAGSYTFPMPITSATTTARAVVVQAKSGGTVRFDGQITATGPMGGVHLNDNAAAATFRFDGGLALSTGAGPAFEGTGAGTVVVTQDNASIVNTLATTTGRALNLSGVAIGAEGVTFRSISANGGANGIVLSNTGSLGGLTVTGTGVAGSGGTIQNTTGADGTTAGIGIYLSGTRAVSLNAMQLNDHANFAIRGFNVDGFTLAHSAIGGSNGTDAASDEASVAFDGLTGSARISRSSISGGLEDNFRVRNTAGVLDRLVFDTVTVGANSLALGNDGVLLEASGSARMDVTVRNSSFTSSRGDLFQLNVLGSARSDLAFTGNTLSNSHANIVSGGGGVTIGGGGAGSNIQLTYDITGNTFRDALGTALILNKGSGAGMMTGRVTNNQIGVTGLANSGSAQGSALAVQLTGGGTHAATIRNNQIHQYNNHGIHLQVGDAASGGQGALHATIDGNTVANPGAFAINGLHLNAGTTSIDQHQVCLAITGNTLAGSGANGSTDFRLRQRQQTTVGLPGYVGAPSDDTAVAAFIQANNGVGLTGAVANSVATGGGGYAGGAGCSTP